MSIWRMRIACWLPKGTNTHSEYVILLFLHCKNGCNNATEFYVISALSSFKEW
jgi:hypothetical protein